MDKITTTSGTVHAVAWFHGRGPNGEATTLCGRKNVAGQTGATIASGITCGSCLRVLRGDGWLV